MADLKPCPFCGGKPYPKGWKANDGRTGPECEACRATAISEVDWERRLLATAEIERLQQALADAHGLLVTYKKIADDFEDIKNDVELHFRAFRQGNLANITDSTQPKESQEAE